MQQTGVELHIPEMCVFGVSNYKQNLLIPIEHVHATWKIHTITATGLDCNTNTNRPAQVKCENGSYCDMI